MQGNRKFEKTFKWDGKREVFPEHNPAVNNSGNDTVCWTTRLASGLVSGAVLIMLFKHMGFFETINLGMKCLDFPEF